MSTCNECKFYKPIDETKGECFTVGSEAPADRDAGRCPIRAFQPRG
jgi:hypothetical protein